jgi:uncharacterized membrane protein
MRFGAFAGMTAAVVLLAAGGIAGCGRGGSDGAGGSGSDGETRPAITEDEMKAKAQALLAALGAPATPEVKAQYAGEFEAVGVEPDWNATFLADYVNFVRPGLDEVNAIAKPRDIRALGAFVEAGPLTVTVRAGACSYGEGGETYPFSATVLFEGVAYEGCARQTSGASTAAKKSWADALSQYLPAIDACLARVQAKPGRVTIAYPGDEGQTSVRLLEADGGRSECVVAADGATVLSVEGLADRNIVAGERDPLFTRAPTAPPQRACLSSEPVAGSSGAVIGHLSRKTC